jgi:apolipoprotein N-acyltransferase
MHPLLGWITRYTEAAGKERQRGSRPVVLYADSLTMRPFVKL